MFKVYIYELKVQILIKVNAIKQFRDKDLDNQVIVNKLTFFVNTPFLFLFQCRLQRSAYIMKDLVCVPFSFIKTILILKKYTQNPYIKAISEILLPDILPYHRQFNLHVKLCRLEFKFCNFKTREFLLKYKPENNPGKSCQYIYTAGTPLVTCTCTVQHTWVMYLG